MTESVYCAIIKLTVKLGGYSIMKKLIFAIIVIAAVIFIIHVIKERRRLASKDPLDLEDDE